MSARARFMQADYLDMSKKLIAEFIGTLWLVLYQRHYPLICAQSREVIEATRSGISRSAFQASQQTSTMAS